MFSKGIHNFRTVLYDNFKLPKDARVGENQIRVTIGIHDSIEKIEILKYTDRNSKIAIEKVFRLKELNKWISARIYDIPVKEEFIVSIITE